MSVLKKITIFTIFTIFVYSCQAQILRTDSLKIVNDKLKILLDESFGTSQNGIIIFIRIQKTGINEYDIKISCDGLMLLISEFNDAELVGFFKYKNAIGIVYGEKKNIFFKKVGEMNKPEYYIQAVERFKKFSFSTESDIPPIRYGGSVYYYKYKERKIVFNCSEWADIWKTN